jgi:hypothetical protein
VGIRCYLRTLMDEELEALIENPSTVSEFLDNDDEDVEGLDIDKAWHGIHFLLTGTAWDGEPPLNFLVGGGKSIGDDDTGYGPVRGFSNSDVRRLGTKLALLPSSELRKRVDAERMNELEIYPYPGFNWSDGEEYHLDGLIHFYQPLREFVREAAYDRMALLVCLG